MASEAWAPEFPRLIYFLNQANQAVRSLLEDALRPLQMTAVQYTVLSVVGAREGVSSAQLARRFFVTPQTMNELIATLERRGLLERRENDVNRRILDMELTRLGRETVAKCDAAADAVERNVCSWMNDAQYHELRTLVRTMARELRDAKP